MRKQYKRERENERIKNERITYFVLFDTFMSLLLDRDKIKLIISFLSMTIVLRHKASDTMYMSQLIVSMSLKLVAFAGFFLKILASF